MRYPIDDVSWLDDASKDHLMCVCEFPAALHHLSWSAMREYLLGMIDKKTFWDFFRQMDSDLTPLAYCILENW